MAEARARTKEIKVTKIVKDGINLGLSDEETKFLYEILQKIGGPTGFSRRRYQVAISRALESAGYHGSPDSGSDLEGIINCKSE